MCGLCGKIYFDRARNVDERTIRAMTDTMIHRGPDDSGTYVSGSVGLGHRRLSIIDLHAGKQPLSNENGQIWIVYNGEVYNYRELRHVLSNRGHVFKTKTDTEVILHLYEELGEDCLSKLRGMFAFAIWDNTKRRLFLARDRVGIKPLYYTLTKDALLFASEVKALLQDASVERAVNPLGIVEFLSYTFTPGPTTAFSHIYKLLPGHYLSLEGNKVSTKQYWDISSYYSMNHQSQNRLESDLLSLLKDSVKAHMVSDVPVGFLLSGGVDSTAMLSFYQEQLTSEIKTFTIGFEGQEFEDERKYARIAAKRYGVDHYETTVTPKQFFDFLPKYIWFMEEPISEPPGVSLYFVSKMAREHVKVLISGEGGDEAFAGYQTYRNLVWLERLKGLFGPTKGAIEMLVAKTDRLLPLDVFRKYGPLFDIPLHEYYFSRASSPASFFNTGLSRLYAREFLDSLGHFSLKRPFERYFNRVSSYSNLRKMLYVDTKTWLPDRLLLKADKMTMANSLELRVPLLDHEVLQFAAGMPDKQKLNGITTKYIFKKILKNRIPKQIIKRKKAGFPIPYSNWLQKNQTYVLDVLLDRKTTERGIFEKKQFRNMVANKWKSTGEHSADIFNLLTLELWHRAFVDSRPEIL